MSKQVIFQIILICSLSYVIKSAKYLGAIEPIIWKSAEVNDLATKNVLSGSVNCNVMLNFSNIQLSRIGYNFITSPYVKNLTLQNNQITVAEENAFNSLPNLEHLDLSNNKFQLDKLFSFGGHQKLEVLILDYNCGNSYCPPTVKTKSEDDLDFNRNENVMSTTTEVPYHYPYEFGYYESTTTQNYYTTNYDSTGALRLYQNNYFPELRFLSLRKIGLKTLTHMFKQCFPKLNHLDISENDLHQPVNKVLVNIPTTLKNLVMEHTGLTAMSTQNFPDLMFLNLNFNKFETVSNHYCYENTLCLQDLHSLLYLSISDCMITKIEIDAFKDTENLLGLDISNNKITDIPNGTFGYISSLKELDLSMNNLITMPDFSLLKNLSSLKLNSMRNAMSYYLIDAFSYMPNLKIISLRHNHIEILTSEFFNNFPSLEEIDLSFNGITSLPAWQSQSNLCNLYLNYNKISNIDDISLLDAKSLKKLYLKNNPVRILKIESLKNISDNATLFL